VESGLRLVVAAGKRSCCPFQSVFGDFVGFEAKPVSSKSFPNDLVSAASVKDYKQV
jgi:hypothetical protein